jgi:hypothetical protein
MAVMAAVAAMHKNVHKRASEQKEVRQRPKDMGFVLIPQQYQCDGSEAKEDEKGPRGPEALGPPSLLIVIRMFV